MDQAMPLELMDWTHEPDQMDVPSAERRMGVCDFTMLRRVLVGVFACCGGVKE
jgi:hypothetical protein